jgi:hypothetical protein
VGVTILGSPTGVTVVTFLFWLLVFFGAQAVVGMLLGAWPWAPSDPGGGSPWCLG